VSMSLESRSSDAALSPHCYVMDNDDYLITRNNALHFYRLLGNQGKNIILVCVSIHFEK
jgi:hypothetical protein